MVPGSDGFAGIPYLAVAHIPYISVAGIEFVASHTAWMLTFSGIDAVTLGDTVINTPTGLSCGKIMKVTSGSGLTHMGNTLFRQE